MPSTDTGGGGGGKTSQQGWSPPTGLLLTHPAGCRGVTVWKGWETDLSARPPGWVRPRFLLWSSAGREQLLSKGFLSCWVLFPGPLVRGSRLLREFLSVPVDISRFLPSSTLGLGNTRQKENPGNSLLCWSLGPGVPKWSDIFSLSLSVFLCLLEYIRSRVFSRTQEAE